MSKLKRRYERNKKAKCTATVHDSKVDRHHLLFQRRNYHGALAELRSYPYCVVSIPKDSLHRMIHESVHNVPTPKPANAREVLQELRTLYRYGGIKDTDDIEKRLVVLIALFDIIEQPTCDALKKQLAIVQEYKSSQ